MHAAFPTRASLSGLKIIMVLALETADSPSLVVQIYLATHSLSGPLAVILVLHKLLPPTLAAKFCLFCFLPHAGEHYQSLMGKTWKLYLSTYAGPLMWSSNYAPSLLKRTPFSLS